MGVWDRFRKKGGVMGSVSIRDLPPHIAFSAYLAFTKVATRDSPFPPDDPGAPFHKCDYAVPIKDIDDPETRPFTFNLEQPTGFYYLILRVMLAREIQGKPGIQIENFSLCTAPVELRSDGTVTVNGSVTWPSMASNDLHDYGLLEDLTRGGA